MLETSAYFDQNGSVQELIENSSLHGQRIPEKKIMQMFVSLCEALLAFHSHEPPYAHRDIKVIFVPENSFWIDLNLRK